MATIANLSIGLSANSAKLSKDLNAAKKKTKAWSASAVKMANLAKVAVVAVGAAFVAAANKAAKFADAIGKHSRAVGMSVEQYQRLTFAIGQAGISQKGAEKGFRKLNSTILDAGRGLSTATDMFDQLGISYESLMSLDPAERFGAVIKALEGIEDAGVRAAIAEDLLGKEFADNQVHYGNMIQDSKDIVTVTAGLTEASADYNDALAAVSTSMRNIMANKFEGFLALAAGYLDILAMKMAGNYEVATDFGEALDNVTLAMGDEIDQANKLFTLMGTGTTITQSAAIATLSNAKAHLTSAEAKLEEAEAEKALQMVLLQRNYQLEVDALKTIREGTDAYEEREQSIATILRRMNELNGYTKGSKEELAKARAEVVRIQTAIDASVDGMVVFDGELITANSLSERLANNFGAMAMPAIITDAQTLVEKLGIGLELAKAIARIGGSSGASGPDAAIQQTRDAYNMNDLIANGIASVSKYSSSSSSSSGGGGGGGSTQSDAAQAAQALMEDLVLAVEAEQGRVQSIGASVVDSIENGFASALKTGDWRGFLDGTMDTFTSTIIDNFAEGLFSPLKDFMSMAIGELMTSLNGSDGGGGIWGALGTIAGALPFADGGIVPTTSSSKSYADSVPAMLQPFLNGGGSGGGQTFNINVTGDVSRLTRSEIVKMMPEIAAGTNMLNKENGRR